MITYLRICFYFLFANESKLRCTYCPPGQNSANTWYKMNKNENKTKADKTIFTSMLHAFLNPFQLPQSVRYKYQATNTIITITIQYPYQNNLAALIIKSDALVINDSASIAI